MSKDNEEPSVLLAHPGTQYAPRLASELNRQGLLKEYWTPIAFARDGVINRWSGYLPNKLQRAISSRIVEGVPACRLRTMPMVELSSLARVRCGADAEAVLHARNANFQRRIPARELEAAGVVIGFDTSSWILADLRRRQNAPFVLDQSIGHPTAKERIYSALRRKYPDWDEGASLKRSELVEVERREHDFAHLIVVPSGFVKYTLANEGVPQEKIRINPFGVDLELFRPDNRVRRSAKVIFLFAGAMGIRKGLPLLLECWQKAALDNSELWIVGGGRIPSSALPLPRGVVLHGKLRRDDLAALMRQADVFVFPSFFEGLAQVQIEALASGLAVLGTFESGAAEIVADGVEGRVLPAGDVDAWVSEFRKLAANPDLVLQMKRAAIARRSTLSWSRYGDRYAEILKEAL